MPIDPNTVFSTPPGAFVDPPPPPDVYATPPPAAPLLPPQPQFTPDYPSRVAAFVQFTGTVYGLDPCAAECLLLPFMTPTLAYPPIWLILHSDRSLLWDHLSLAITRLGLPPVEPLSIWRLRDVQAQFEFAHYLTLFRRLPRLLIDHALQDSPLRTRRKVIVNGQPTHMATYRAFWFRWVERECLRLVIKLPHMAPPPHGSAEQLARLFLRAVDWSHRDKHPVPIQPSGQLMSTLALLLRLNPEFAEWPYLSTGLCLAPAAHAALHGRSTLTVADTPILTRLVQSCLYGWRWEILRELSGPATTIERIVRACGAPRPSVIEILNCWREAGVVQFQGMEMAKHMKQESIRAAGGGRKHRPIIPTSERQRKIHSATYHYAKAVTLTREYAPDVRRLVSGDVEWW